MPLGYKLTSEDRQAIVDAYNAGGMLNDLAAQFDVRRGTIIYHLKQAGVPLRGNKNGPRKPYPYNEVMASLGFTVEGANGDQHR